MNSFPAISIVVPTYNRGHFIEKAFSALVNQNYPKDKLEIIVVDDGSRDGTPEILGRFEKQYPYFRYFTQPNRGPAAARNLGIRHAKGEIILFIDDDCIADENWALELTRGYGKAEAAGVAGRIKYVPPGDNISNQFAAHADGQGQPFGADGEIDFFVTANASFMREVLDKVGRFDETFPHAVHEDVDLSHRIKQAGWKLSYSDAAVVHHYHHHTVRGNVRKWYQLGNAEALYFLKRGASAPLWTAIPLALLAFLKVPFGFSRGLAAGLGVKKSFMFPLLHRLHRLTVAAGWVRGHFKYRALFMKEPAAGGESRHAIMEHLMRTRVSERFDGGSLPVYGDDDAAKLGRIQMDLERILFTLGLIRNLFERPSQVKVLELGANPYFLTEMIQKHLGAEVMTNGSPLGLEGRGGDEIRSGVVSFINPEAGVERTVDNRLFNVEEDGFPYGAGQFDLVICQELIEHLLFSPTSMLNEIHRVLRKGGKVIISCPNMVRVDVLKRVLANKNPNWGYVRSTGGERPRADWPTLHGVYGRHNREYTLAEVEDLVRGCGFKVLRAECVTFHLPEVQLSLRRPRLFLRTLVYRAMKAATFLPVRFLRLKKDFVFVVAEKEGDEPVAYYPPTLYDAWQVQEAEAGIDRSTLNPGIADGRR